MWSTSRGTPHFSNRFFRKMNFWLNSKAPIMSTLPNFSFSHMTLRVVIAIFGTFRCQGTHSWNCQLAGFHSDTAAKSNAQTTGYVKWRLMAGKTKVSRDTLQLAHSAGISKLYPSLLALVQRCNCKGRGQNTTLTKLKQIATKRLSLS